MPRFVTTGPVGLQLGSGTYEIQKSADGSPVGWVWVDPRGGSSPDEIWILRKSIGGLPEREGLVFEPRSATDSRTQFEAGARQRLGALGEVGIYFFSVVTLEEDWS